MRLAMVSLFAFVGSMGCAIPPNFPSQAELYDEPRDPDRFVFLSHGSEDIGARVNQGGVLGAAVNIGRYTAPDDHALRGHIYDRLVEMRFKGDRVTGYVASLPIDLTVSRREGALHARGVVYGRRVILHMTDEHMSAVLDRCEMSLMRRGAVYVGTRRCKGFVQSDPVELQVGRGFAGWSDVERVSALSLLLFFG